MPRPTGHLAALCATAIAGVAMAQDPAGVLDRPAPSVDELMKRLDTLEERNRELENRVTDLSRQQGEEWLGEQRAGQIRDIVRDVLADSEQRASLQDGGVTAGWNDGFFLASPDGRFRMNIGGFTQARFIWSSIQPGSYNAAGAAQQYVFDRNPNRYGFDVPNVQLWADGHVFSRDFQYMVKARFVQELSQDFNKGSFNNQSQVALTAPGSGGVELMDAWVRANLDDHWSVRFGQFRTPFSRGFLVLEQYQMSASRSVVDYHYALGYTQGIELEHQTEETRMRASINNGDQDNLMGDTPMLNGGAMYKVWSTGSFGGQNAPYWQQNSDFSVTSRFDWKPAGSWSQFQGFTSPSTEAFALLTGLGIHYQQSRAFQGNEETPSTSNPDSQWLAATVDAQANFGGASVYGAFFYNYVEAPGALYPAFGDGQSNVRADLGSINIFAAQLQGAVYLMPKVELYGRYEFAQITGVNSAQINANNPELNDPDPLNLLTVGVNWYIDGQDLKWTTDFGWAITAVHPWFADVNAGWRPSQSGEIVVRTQLQLMF